MENNVELRGLCRRFSGKVALDGLTFRMYGCVFGLLGGKGAGKSTLLRILATLLPGDGGEALVCGLPLARAGAVRAIVGYLPEDFCFYGGLRAGEAMDYLGALSGLDALTRRARTAQLLERVGLDGQAQTHIRRFDTGMLRRLGVAQALIHDPRVLLLDEPTAGLAPEERARLRSLLAETAIDRLVVLATQRPDDIEAVCARVAVLDGGKLLYLGTARARCSWLSCPRARWRSCAAAFAWSASLNMAGAAWRAFSIPRARPAWAGRIAPASKTHICSA